MWNSDKRLQTQVGTLPSKDYCRLTPVDWKVTLCVPFMKTAIIFLIAVQVTEVADDTLTIRSLDWDRDRFDIEFG